MGKYRQEEEGKNKIKGKATLQRALKGGDTEI